MQLHEEPLMIIYEWLVGFGMKDGVLASYTSWLENIKGVKVKDVMVS